MTVLVLGCGQGLLTTLAHAAGISYAPSALFAVAFLFVLVMLVHFSMTDLAPVRPEQGPRPAPGAAATARGRTGAPVRHNMHGTRIKHLTGHSTSRYLVVGVSAFGADYALLLFTYYVVGLPLTIATSIGFFSGFAISFTFNKQWVFGGERRSRQGR